MKLISIAFVILSVLITIGAGIYQIGDAKPQNTELLSPPGLLTEDGSSRYIPSKNQVTDQWINETDSQVVALAVESSPEDEDDIPEIDADLSNADDATKIDGVSNDPSNNIDLAKSNPGLAVIPFKQSSSINERDAGKTLANLLLSEIDSATYTLFERGQITALLEEAKFQESDLVDSTARAVEFGKLAGIRYLVIGELSKLGKIRWTARVIDCQTGQIGEKGSVSLFTFQEVDRAIPEMLAVLKLNDASSVIGDDSQTLKEPAGHEEGKPLRKLTGVDLVDAYNPDSVFSVQLTTREGKTTYIEGETISFEVTADADCFLTLVAVDPAGDITLLMPNRWQHRAFVRRGESLTLPSPGMEFEFPIQPPHGQTIVKLIATTVPFALRNVDSKRLDLEGFIDGGSIHQGSKAIGVAGDENQVLHQKEFPVINDRFKSHQWTTAEIVTTSSATNITPVTPPAENDLTPIDSDPRQPQKEPLVPVATGEDPNDQVIKRWIQLESEAKPQGWGKTSELSNRLSRLHPQKIDGLLVVRTDTLGSKGAGKLSAGYRSEHIAWPQGQKTIGQDWETYAKILKEQDPTIITIFPDKMLHAYSPIPSTQLAEVQWSLENKFNVNFDTAWHHAQQDFPPESDMPLVAVIDQGADIADTRIAQYAWINPGEIPNNQIDDDKNGYVDDVHGYHFAHNSATLSDPSVLMNHGSFVSSIVASKPIGQKKDVIGVAQGVHVMSVGALKLYPEHQAGAGSQSVLVEALLYAVSNGAKIINLSLGGQASLNEVLAFAKHPIWDILEQSGVLIIIAAGNENTNNDVNPSVPANISLLRPNIITVMAIDAAGQRARFFNAGTNQWEPFSNYGKQSVQIAAPGSSMLGIPAFNKVVIADGTSFSAPIVTGAAALVWGKHPEWDYSLVKRAILESARKVEGFEDLCSTGGILDIQAALEWTP